IKPTWESFATAVMAAAPNVRLIGPAAAASGLMTLTVPFAADEASKLVLLTQHHYGPQAGTGGATLASLLTTDGSLVSTLSTVAQAATSNHIPDGFRLGECNTFSHHGTDGISNALVSALWGIDFLFVNAMNGSSGVNLHGGQLGMDSSLPTLPFYYAPIQEANGAVTEAAPLFYGMLLFTLAGNGNVLKTTTSAAGINLTAYAVAHPDGSTNVVLNNKDATSAVTATVDLGAPVTAGAVIYLQGPTPVSLSATSGVTIAGAGISPTGAWTPSAPYALTASGNTVSVVVPPASAALVHAH
ncbi:MAG TPA: glycosyl hydrolase family 79 C-terminal domain-containing protein, partial [Polyangiaceae bacterium]|nr:glycosyl hydrolase family 79 C-terminal domain-containing protein [Polyangiaceae bacterium]